MGHSNVVWQHLDLREFRPGDRHPSAGDNLGAGLKVEHVNFITYMCVALLPSKALSAAPQEQDAVLTSSELGLLSKALVAL